jgi:catechol 2,3-dioxygenase-like lactoylglutathione lyase family enzyme
MPPVVGIVETAIYVDDLDQAEAFYGDVLGLALIGREPGRHSFFRVGRDNVLLLFNPATTINGDVLLAHGAIGPGHFAIGIPADALEEWKRRLIERHVAIEQEVSWPRGGRSIYFRDPAGNAVELLTPGLWGLPSGW